MANNLFSSTQDKTQGQNSSDTFGEEGPCPIHHILMYGFANAGNADVRDFREVADELST